MRIGKQHAASAHLALRLRPPWVENGRAADYKQGVEAGRAIFVVLICLGLATATVLGPDSDTGAIIGLSSLAAMVVGMFIIGLKNDADGDGS